MKKQLLDLLKEVVNEQLGVNLSDFPAVILSHPPTPEMGDYASNVALVLSKELKRSPKEIAESIASSSQLLASSFIQKIEVVGGFINFTMSPGEWAKEVLGVVSDERGDYGNATFDKSKVMVEFLSPNTNKPLHLGHMRNGILANAVINILRSQNQDVVKVGIINDRGVHICKAMLAYKIWGGESTPESSGVKPDHFVGDWYVRFSKEADNDPSLQQQAQDMLVKWERGDEETIALWKKMRQWVLQGWKETEEVMGFSYDKAYFESDVYTYGKDIVASGLEKGVFRKNEEGHTVFDLSTEEFGTDENGNARFINVLRADGTSLYTTQDLGLAVSRAQEWNIDKLIYVVGSEQKFHFQALFAMLKALGYAWAKDLRHLWYGMVYLPDGKMKSREGTVVDADDLISEVRSLAKEEIHSRSPESGVDIDSRARIIALAAIKFYFLKVKASSDIHFDPKESISFEGFTGPYCLYSYARSKSILRASSVIPTDSGYSNLSSAEEREVIRQLEEYPEIVARAASEYNPAVIAMHVFETCQAFNTFYTKHQVLKAENEEIKNARLQLVAATAQVIKNGLGLLGIETVEEM